MDKLKFQKLTPTQEVDLSGYEDAFHYIFAEDDIRNIALSGAYSSGKSSVIESYKKCHPDKTFMHLSLAHFQGLGESADKKDFVDSDDDDEAGSSQSYECVIEGKILNQLIQQIPAEKIPQTNFRIKRSLDWKKPALVSVLICVFIVVLFHCTKFVTWKSIVTGLNDGFLKDFLMVSTYPGARILSVTVMVCLIGIALFRLIMIQHSKNILRKVSVQGNEIEIFSDGNDSYFDKYLNEVLYLFENTGVDGIVFEDIDRFDNHTIFERLREINTLTNIRLQNKKGKNIRKPLRFFYLLRDDIFENKDRTKFFDFILPVVPVLDSSNSYNKIKEYLESAGLYSQFDDHFLRGTALYIDDLRIVKNIFNEFLIYNQKLNRIELDVNKLFAIIVYKNIFPKDFTDLQLNRGFVHTLFESRERLVAARIASVNEAIIEIEERISCIENEHLKNQAELDAVRASKEREANRFGSWSQQYQDYQEWNKNVYPKRKQALEDRKEENISELRRLVEQKKEEKSKIENMQLAALLDRQNTDDAFRVDYINEIQQVEHFYAIKGNPYFPLLKYLISRGYIDESYTDYMTFFYTNSLSLRDKVFLRAVADRNGKQTNYELDSPALVTENLNEYDFSQSETLNYTLSEYILNTNKNDYVKSMIFQIRSEKRFDYIAGYMCSEKAIVPMVVAIDYYWPEMFYEALTKHALSDDLIKRFSYVTLTSVEDEILDAVNIDGCLRDYVSEDQCYLIVNDIDTEKLGRALSYLEVSFVEINPDGVNEFLFDYVHQHDLYEINASNIRLMLGSKCSTKDIEDTLHALFTFMRDQQSDYAVCKYLWTQIDKTLPVYLDMYAGSIQDRSETIVELLNNETVDQNQKQAYVERLTTKVDRIEAVTSSNDQKMLVIHKKADYSVENVLYYFKRYGMTEELITFINSDTLPLDYIDNADDACVEKFLDKCIREETIEDEKYRQIMENICNKMQEFSVEDLSDDKVKILVDLGLIEMNSSNLKFMRITYPASVLHFIRLAIEEYIPIAVDSDFDLKEATAILEWEEVADQQKIKLLEQTTEGIRIHGKQLSEGLIQYILTNNLCKEDWPWILECYDKFSDDVKTTILMIASGRLEYVASNHSDNISKVLLDQLYKSDTADSSAKVLLLEKTAKTMDKDKLCTVLQCLGADKIADNISGGKKRVKYSNENMEILRALYSAGVISKPEQTADGQYYKVIKFRTRLVNESPPSTL